MVRSPKCSCIHAQTLFSLLGKKWMIFILQSVSYGAHTFTDIRLAIGEANTKILSDRLAELVEMKLLTKDTESRYDLSDRGRELAQKMKKLAEWWGSTYPKE